MRWMKISWNPSPGPDIQRCQQGLEGFYNSAMVKRRQLRTLVLVVGMISSLPFSSIHAEQGINGRDHGVAIPSHVTFGAIPVCFDFGCRNRVTVNLPVSEWDSVAGWFREPAATPEEERNQIRQAIGWMEVLIGRYTPTHRDLAADELNEEGLRESGQLDCIDESVNTTTYLKLFESSGFLQHHVVIEEAYRRAIFDQHWAGQIREVATGNRYVVDSWFQPNGYLPIIQNSESWEDINILTAVVDNRPDEEGKEVERSFWHRFLRGGL